MQTISHTPALRRWRTQRRQAGEHVALVPTMGNLHEGHLELVRRAQVLAARVVVSLFVNPMQFDRAADLSAYPRTPQRDRELLEATGVDLLFAPSVGAMYPRGPEMSTAVEVPGLTEILCGASRPGHFRGVATVVTKLFNMVQPDVAVFGEKDYQQLLVIRRMVEDLDLPVEVVGAPTMREPDGLAMSSRNAYLDGDQRALAPVIYRTLSRLAQELRAGNRDYGALERWGTLELATHGMEPDYVSVRRRADLAPAGDADRELVVLAAARLGVARLIDNIQVTID